MDHVKNADKVCFFSHFNRRNSVHECVYRYLWDIKKIGFSIIFITTSPLDKIDTLKIWNICDDIIIRDNINLDWGGWIEAYQKYNPIRANYLLLCNDSVFGPIWSLQKFWESLTEVESDFYGAVCSNQVKRHVQSWFMVFGKRLRASDLFKRRLLEPMPLNMPKWDIINEYEINLSHTILESDEWRTRIAFDPDEFIGAPYCGNPTLELGLQALESGILPFLKRELLRDNPINIERVSRWPEIVANLDPKWVPMIQNALKNDRQAMRRSMLSSLAMRVRKAFD